MEPATATINDALPDALLSNILGLLHPQLAPVLVCRHWHRLITEQCPGWWAAAGVSDAALPLGLGQEARAAARRALLRGFTAQAHLYR